MGIFDKKRRSDEEFDSPVEVIDLTTDNTPPPRASTTQAAPSARTAAAPPEEADYGINRAIQLMRSLPGDNVELVVRVVKATLESARVKVSTIIADASRKMTDIESRIGLLKSQIADFESEIASRKSEIEGLESDHRETAMVKERLVLAERLSSPPPAPAAAATPAKESVSTDAVAVSRAPRQTPAPVTHAIATGPTAISGTTGGVKK